VNDRLSFSFSIFTIEADRKPVAAFRCRKYSEAETICGDERVRKTLCSISSGGKPICDDLAILRVRMARPEEKATYYEQAVLRSNDAGLTMIYLVELDGRP
jgi:hypothetical protein